MISGDGARSSLPHPEVSIRLQHRKAAAVPRDMHTVEMAAVVARETGGLISGLDALDHEIHPAAHCESLNWTGTRTAHAPEACSVAACGLDVRLGFAISLDVAVVDRAR